MELRNISMHFFVGRTNEQKTTFVFMELVRMERTVKCIKQLALLHKIL
jgi:hypothetical protein